MRLDECPEEIAPDLAEISISRHLEVASCVLLTPGVLVAQVPLHGAAGVAMGGSRFGGAQAGSRR